MKADLSRSTFSAPKHYRDVRLQQGRVALDADFNEYVDIAAHRVETETLDVVGRCGAPMHDAAFQIATDVSQLPKEQQAAATALGALAKGDFYLSAGRYYAQGVLCENDSPLTYVGQAAADFPGASALAASGLYLAYLDVWPRHLTFIDDPSLREVALNGPDTATRQKTIWQVKLVRVGDTGAAADCNGTYPDYDDATAAGTGQLAAEADPSTTSKKPCVLPPGGGYRRLENQLYRVEIHDAGLADDKATFKWSRDNGAVVSGWEATGDATKIKLLNPPRDDAMAFVIGGWVELGDDTSELLGAPGKLFEVADVKNDILTLKTAVTPADFPRNPKVRRWDSVGSVGVTTADWIPLEDGVRVKFSAGTYKTGDYWLIPARTATGQVEWPKSGGVAAFIAPAGVAHRYCRIGFVDFDGTTIKPQDCRPLFPPLTEIGEGGDLKLHNKHLHGKGVVCGLQVNCGGEDRSSVLIKTGHAIDCEGTDILVKTPVTFPVVERAKAESLIDATGTGQVQLVLKADAAAQPIFDLRAAPPDDAKGVGGVLKQILEGTLWMDFYDDCLKPLSDYLQKTLTVDKSDTSLVPDARRRLLTIANLVAHRGGTAPNRRLWLSETEHNFLAQIYGDLEKLAGESDTFCGISDTFPAFPAYPFSANKIGTAFAARALTGVRASPDLALAYSWSAGDPAHLYLFDLATGELTVDATLDGSDGLTVQDVAIVNLGKGNVVVVSTADATQTVLQFLDTRTLAAVQPPVVLKGGVLTALAANPHAQNTLIAVQKGAGVQIFTPTSLISGAMPTPRFGFNAAGHLTINFPRVCATEAAAGVSDGSYTAVRFGNLATDGSLIMQDFGFSLAQFNPAVSNGQDGIAFAGDGKNLSLHVVVNPPLNSQAKAAMVIDGFNPHPLALINLPLADDGGTETGAVDVSPGPSGFVAYSIEKRNQAFFIPATGNALSPNLTLPAQMAPGAMDFDLKANQFLIANRTGQTLTVVPAAQFSAASPTDPQIAAYRDAVLSVFTSLILTLLQQLKDCLCEHLLRDCPECGPDEVLTLATIDIRNSQVYHICNFCREEVLTFPKVKYWLSAVPVIPVINYLVEKFCCWIIPLPSTPTSGGAAPVNTGANVISQVMVGALQFAKPGAFKSAVSPALLRVQGMTSHFVQALSQRFVNGPVNPPSNSIPIGNVVNTDVQKAESGLIDRGVVVAGVSSYGDALAKRDLIDISALPTSLGPGDKVQLYVRDNRVVYFTRVVDAPAPVSGGVTLADLQGAASAIQNQITQVKSDQATQLQVRDEQIAELKATNDKLQTEVQGIAASPVLTESVVTASDLQSRLDAVQAQLAAQQQSHAADLAARDQQIAALKTSNDQLRVQVQQVAASPVLTEPVVTTPDLQAKLDAISAQMAAQQQAHAADLAARDKQIADLRSASDRLNQNLITVNKKLNIG